MILSFFISIPFMLAKEGAKWGEFVTTFNTNPIVSFNLIASGMCDIVYRICARICSPSVYIYLKRRVRDLSTPTPLCSARWKNALWFYGFNLLAIIAPPCPPRRPLPWRMCTCVCYVCVYVPALWFYGYNELATMTIKKTSAVTQSVANTAKRVIVIVGVAIVSYKHTRARAYVWKYICICLCICKCIHIANDATRLSVLSSLLVSRRLCMYTEHYTNTKTSGARRVSRPHQAAWLRHRHRRCLPLLHHRQHLPACQGGSKIKCLKFWRTSSWWQMNSEVNRLTLNRLTLNRLI